MIVKSSGCELDGSEKDPLPVVLDVDSDNKAGDGGWFSSELAIVSWIVLVLMFWGVGGIASRLN
jgi:hypothetical protein